MCVEKRLGVPRNNNYVDSTQKIERLALDVPDSDCSYASDPGVVSTDVDASPDLVSDFRRCEWNSRKI